MSFADGAPPPDGVTLEPVAGDPYHDDPAVRAMVNPTTAPDPRQGTGFEGQQLTAFEPSWRQRAAQWLFGDKPISPEKAATVHGLLGTTGLDQPSMSVADLTPVGQVLSAQEQAKAGNYSGAAVAMLPGMGAAEREAMAAGRPLERALLAAPGSLERTTAERSLAHEADRVSTRVPTAVGAPDAHASNDLKIDMDAYNNSPVAMERNADRIRSYDGTDIPKDLSAADTTEAYINHLTNNHLAIYNRMDPTHRDNSMLWYDGGNDIVHGLAKDYSILPRQSAGVIASQSPQRDWNMNVSLAHRIIDIHNNQQATAITPEMNDWFRDYIARKGDTPEAAVAQDFLDRNQGVPFGQMTDKDDRAHFIRGFDEAHNSRSFDILKPDGTVHGTAMNKDGVTPSRIQWGSMDDIAKGASIMMDGSLENVSRNLGEAHKVRSFYNNLIAPYSPAGDVTVDTHALAGGNFYPLTSSDLMTSEGLGQGGNKDSRTGVMGLYAPNVEAIRRAAAQVGVLPRQMQSMSWEGTRAFFIGPKKSNIDYRAGIEQPWIDHQNGLLSQAEAQDRAFAAAGTPAGQRIKPPDWAVSVPGSDAAAGNTANAGELPARRVYGRPTGPAWRGTGRAPPPAVPDQRVSLEPAFGDPYYGVA